jgi:hypothetical protein
MFLRKNLGENYSPLYFLAALGNGGLAVSFFIYLMFLVPHPETPIVTFHAIVPVLRDGGLLVQGSILVALAAILIFAVRHFLLLAWNIREYRRFTKTAGYTRLKAGNGEVALMAIPLTLAMSINVGFVLGGVFVPGIWGVVEYLFPFTLAGFLAIGLYALRIFGTFFSRVLTEGNFNCARNNNLSQMIAIFAFTMVGVGFAAPAAMSQHITIAALGAFGSIFFISTAVLLGLVAFVLGFRSMLEHGIDQETSASLWIILPILTLIGISFVRLSHGLHHHFDSHSGPATIFVLTSAFVSLQLLFGGLGYMVMRRVGYYREFVSGSGKSPGSYALICPGVAFFVFGMFFIHPGLMQSGVIERFSLAHWLLIAPLTLVQVQTIRVMLQLDRKLLRPESQPTSGDRGEQEALSTS